MYKKYIKRVLDILFSFFSILLVSPIMIPVMIGLLLTGEHKVFYFQKRIGLNNKPFYIWKFATMLKNSPNLVGGLHTTRNDPRVLPFGAFLRKTKLNELPQFINVFKGDMSVVGPRPLVDKTFAPYPQNVKDNIYKIKPGLTGIGSIVLRDEEFFLSNTDLKPEDFYSEYISPFKGELEMWYQKNYSFWTDLLIVFSTIWVIVFPKSEIPYKLFSTLPPKPDIFVKNV